MPLLVLFAMHQFSLHLTHQQLNVVLTDLHSNLKRPIPIGKKMKWLKVSCWCKCTREKCSSEANTNKGINSFPMAASTNLICLNTSNLPNPLSTPAFTRSLEYHAGYLSLCSLFVLFYCSAN